MTDPLFRSHGPDPKATPVVPRARIMALDALRGLALFGVFAVNLTGFGTQIMATEKQMQALPTAGIDAVAQTLIDWLLVDKANTMFAVLFGLGFWIQMERLSARGADFPRLYRRRLAVLLLAGLIHINLLWSWDILQMYAIAGFVLLTLRQASSRTLLLGGSALALLGYPAYWLLATGVDVEGWHGLASVWDDDAILRRQSASEAGDYIALLQEIGRYNLLDYLFNGLFVGFFLYVLGRFLLGAWIARQGWLQNTARFMPGFRRVLRVALPLGLIAEGLICLLQLQATTDRLPHWDHWALLTDVLHVWVVPVLAVGYGCAIVVWLHHPSGHRYLTPFADVGRMALSCYVGQSLLIALFLFGVPPGFALAGKIGTAGLFALSVAGYAGQVVLSRWWLARFRYGPLEWLWRGLTYGTLPRMRRASVEPLTTPTIRPSDDHAER